MNNMKNRPDKPTLKEICDRVKKKESEIDRIIQVVSSDYDTIILFNALKYVAKFAKHDKNCQLNKEWHFHKGCDCGLGEILKELQ
ncbi:hypothetical protein C4577_02920 [Candidatus Parcubacteria bacterium]|nr:MAG: hypothetical protein C4577_02920 [Candidatus Parcubacteria bacterium]